MDDNSQSVKSQNGYLVAKSNRLITDTKYSVTLQQQRELLFLISMIKPDDDVDTMYTFSINEFAKACGVAPVNGTYYQLIKDDIQRIAEMSCWIKVDGNTDKYVLFHWIDKAVIHLGEGKLGITFHETVTKHLFGLREQYTIYELDNALKLSSKYSVRLYEFLKAMVRLHTVVIEVNELKDRLDANKKKYKSFPQFRQSVLQPAAFDVNTYTDIRVGYKFIKTGQATTHIVFDIEYAQVLAESINTDVEVERQIDVERKEARKKEVVREIKLDQQWLAQQQQLRKEMQEKKEDQRRLQAMKKALAKAKATDKASGK